MKNRTYFKIISFILIQTFLILDICCASAGQAIIRNTNDTTLSPAINIDSMELELIFSDLLEDGSGVSLENVDKKKTSEEGIEIKASIGIKKDSVVINKANNSAVINQVNYSENSSDSVPVPPPIPNKPEDKSLSQFDVAGINDVNSDDDKNRADKKFTFGGLPVVDFRGGKGFSVSPQEVTNLNLDVRDTSRLFTKVRIIAARYSEENRWPGFRTFNIALSDDPYAVMILDDKDNTALSINKDAIPDLIKLMNESQPLFVDLIQALLAHEGGVKGHGTITPLREDDVDWFNMNFSQITTVIYNAIVHRQWPVSVERRGTPPSSEWKTIANILWYGLINAGFDPGSANPFGIRWVESSANIGVADEKGVYGVAVMLWFFHNYRKYEDISSDSYSLISLERNLAENFAFLEMQGINQEDVFSEIENVQKKYESLKKNIGSFGMGTTLTSIASVLLLIGVAMPSLSWGADAVVQTAGLGGVDVLAIVIAGAVLFAGKFIWDRLPFGKSVEQRTVQLVNKTISRKNPSDLRAYYQSANMNDKIKIINITAQELSKKSDKANLRLFENIFLDGLNERTRSVALNMQTKVKSLFKQRINSEIKLSEMISILNEVVRETGINVYQGYPRTVELKLTKIINSLVRADNLNADSFISAITRDDEFDASIDRMLVSEFVKKATKLHYETGNSNKALTIIISDYKDKYNLKINVDKVVAQSAEYFKDFSLTEDQKIGVLTNNNSFMNSFVQAQRNAQVRVLFNNMLKQIIITRETQKAALSKIIAQAIQQVLAQEITGGESMFPEIAEIAILVGRLALEGKLHYQDVFVEQAQSMSAISRVMNAEQMRALHNAIVNLLESGYKNPENTKVGFVAAEFDRAGLVSKPRVLNSGFAAAVLVTAKRENVSLLNTPLAQIGEQSKASGVAEEIGKHYVFGLYNPAEQEKLKEIIINLDKILINNMALGLVFKNINDIVAKELKDLDLNNISNQRTQLVLVNILGKGALLNNLQLARAGEFKQALDMKVDELIYAAVGGLELIVKKEAGTGEMVAQLKNYLNNVPNIRIATKIDGILNDLSEQGKAAKAVVTAKDLTSAVSGSRDEYTLDLRKKTDLTSAVLGSRDDLKFAAPEIVINKVGFQTRFIVESAI